MGEHVGDSGGGCRGGIAGQSSMGTGSGPGWRPAGEAESRLGSGPGRVAIGVASGARPLEEGPIIAQPRLVIGAELAGEAVIKVLIEARRRVAREMEPRVLATGEAAGRGLLRVPVMVVRPVGQGRGQEIGQGQRPPGVPGAGVHGDDLRQRRDPVRDNGSELISLLMMCGALPLCQEWFQDAPVAPGRSGSSWTPSIHPRPADRGGLPASPRRARTAAARPPG